MTRDEGGTLRTTGWGWFALGNEKRRLGRLQEKYFEAERLRRQYARDELPIKEASTSYASALHDYLAVFEDSSDRATFLQLASDAVYEAAAVIDNGTNGEHPVVLRLYRLSEELKLDSLKEQGVRFAWKATAALYDGYEAIERRVKEPSLALEALRFFDQLIQSEDVISTPTVVDDEYRGTAPPGTHSGEGESARLRDH